MPSLRKMADSSQADSLALRARRRRFVRFERLLESRNPPIQILDLGGTERFWVEMGFVDVPGISIVLLNLGAAVPTSGERIESISGDARDLSRFGDDAFDVVFSNSVIEHVGDLDDQRRMAEEIRRVGRSYFVQTPNRYFPIEPHFLLPLFQFLPLWLQVFIVRHFTIGYAGKAPDRASAERRVKSVQLLTRKQFAALFPGARLYRERFLGWTKSFVVVDDGRTEP